MKMNSPSDQQHVWRKNLQGIALLWKTATLRVSCLCPENDGQQGFESHFTSYLLATCEAYTRWSCHWCCLHGIIGAAEPHRWVQRRSSFSSTPGSSHRTNTSLISVGHLLCEETEPSGLVRLMIELQVLFFSTSTYAHFTWTQITHWESSDCLRTSFWWMVPHAVGSCH